jgi:hypothetical protein
MRSTLIEVFTGVGITEGSQYVGRELDALRSQAEMALDLFLAMFGISVMAHTMLDR